MPAYVSPLDHLMDHNCTLCPLHEGSERVCVGGSGSIKKGGIMIVGEAPGENEDKTGRVFSGRAGQLLDLHLAEAGLQREDIYVTNVARCRPADNARPKRPEWEACRRYLESEVEAIRPSFVLLLGNTALQCVARKSGITTKRGVRLDIRDPVWRTADVMATIHPAFVLRNPGQGTVFSEDLKRFARMVAGEFRAVSVKPKLVRNLKALEYVKKLLENAPPGTVVSYDVENRGRPWENEWDVVCLGISLDGETTYVIPLSHPQSPFRKNWRKVLRYLAPALSRHGHKLVAQNGKHDNAQLAGAGVYLQHTFDIMLAAHLLDENRPKNLGYLSQNVLGADIYKGMVELKPEKIMGEPLRKICEYNGYDVGYTHQIYGRLREELIAQPRLLRLFVKLLMPASNVIQVVETAGMYVDQKLLWDRIAILQSEIAKRKKVLYAHLPQSWPDRDEFNFNSTQQLGRWLFSKAGLGLSPLELTATGNPSTREAVLLHYHGHPAVRALLEYRTLELKWLRTYLLPWSARLDSRSRLHTTYKLYGTVTGRLSGDLQQVPRDSFIRGVIGAPTGWCFVQADYSQIELRIAAHCSGEKRMRRAFLSGEDIHLINALKSSGRSPIEIAGMCYMRAGLPPDGAGTKVLQDLRANSKTGEGPLEIVQLCRKVWEDQESRRREWWKSTRRIESLLEGGDIPAPISKVPRQILLYLFQEVFPRRSSQGWEPQEQSKVQPSDALQVLSQESSFLLKEFPEWKELRKKGKAVSFGFLYGMYPKKFQNYAFENYELEVTLSEAELARTQYFETFPGLVGWHDRQRRIAHNYHRVVSPLGRVRHLPDILSSDNGVRMEAERQAINSPVQATASDLMLFSMVQLHKLLDPREAFMVGTLHDAIFFQVREEAVEKWASTIKETMENLPLKKTFGFDPTVPIIADIDYDQHWSGTPDASGLGMDKLIGDLI